MAAGVSTLTFIISIIKIIFVFLWRVLTSSIVYLRGVVIFVNNNRQFFFYLVVLSFAGLGTILLQQQFQTTADYAWECGVYPAQQVLYSFYARPVQQLWDIVIVGYNDIVMYLREGFSVFLEALQFLSGMNIFDQVAAFLQDTSNLLVHILRFPISIPSIVIPNVTSAYLWLENATECIVDLVTRILSDIVRVTIISEDCQFCAFDAELGPQQATECTIVEFSLSGNVNCSDCHDYTLDLFRAVQFAVEPIINLIFEALGIDCEKTVQGVTISFTQGLIIDTNNLVNWFYKRPLFVIFGLIDDLGGRDCLSFSDILTQIERWFFNTGGNSGMTCGPSGFECPINVNGTTPVIVPGLVQILESVLDTFTCGEFDDFVTLLLGFFSELIQAIEIAQRCAQDPPLQACFDRWPDPAPSGLNAQIGYCQIGQRSPVPSNGVYRCLQFFFDCLIDGPPEPDDPFFGQMNPIWGFLIPFLGETIVTNATQLSVDLITCPIAAVIGCFILHSDCSGLDRCIEIQQDVASCISDFVPYLTPIANGYSELFRIIGDVVGALEGVFQTVAGFFTCTTGECVSEGLSNIVTAIGSPDCDLQEATECIFRCFDDFSACDADNTPTKRKNKRKMTENDDPMEIWRNKLDENGIYNNTVCGMQLHSRLPTKVDTKNDGLTTYSVYWGCMTMLGISGYFNRYYGMPLNGTLVATEMPKVIEFVYTHGSRPHPNDIHAKSQYQNLSLIDFYKNPNRVYRDQHDDKFKYPYSLELKRNREQVLRDYYSKIEEKSRHAVIQIEEADRKRHPPLLEIFREAPELSLLAIMKSGGQMPTPKELKKAVIKRYTENFYAYCISHFLRQVEQTTKKYEPFIRNFVAQQKMAAEGCNIDNIHDFNVTQIKKLCPQVTEVTKQLWLNSTDYLGKHSPIAKGQIFKIKSPRTHTEYTLSDPYKAEQMEIAFLYERMASNIMRYYYKMHYVPPQNFIPEPYLKKFGLPPREKKTFNQRLFEGTELHQTVNDMLSEEAEDVSFHYLTERHVENKKIFDKMMRATESLKKIPFMEAFQKVYQFMNERYAMDDWQNVQTMYAAYDAAFRINGSSFDDFKDWVDGKKGYIVGQGYVNTTHYVGHMKQKIPKMMRYRGPSIPNVADWLSRGVDNHYRRQVFDIVPVQPTNFTRTNITMLLLISLDAEDIWPPNPNFTFFMEGIKAKYSERNAIVRMKEQQTASTFDFNEFIINVIDFLIGDFIPIATNVSETINAFLNDIENINYGQLFYESFDLFLRKFAICTYPGQIEGESIWGPPCLPLIPESIFDWINFTAQSFPQIPWPVGLINTTDQMCMNIYNGVNEPFWNFELSDNCQISFAGRPFCDNGCDYCEREYFACRELGFLDGLDSFFFILGVFPTATNSFFNDRVNFLLIWEVTTSIYILAINFGAFVASFGLALLGLIFVDILVVIIASIVFWFVFAILGDPTFEQIFFLLYIAFLIAFPGVILSSPTLALLTFIITVVSLLNVSGILSINIGFRPLQVIVDILNYINNANIFFWLGDIQFLVDKAQRFNYPVGGPVPGEDIFCAIWTWGNIPAGILGVILLGILFLFFLQLGWIILITIGDIFLAIVAYYRAWRIQELDQETEDNEDRLKILEKRYSKFNNEFEAIKQYFGFRKVKPKPPSVIKKTSLIDLDQKGEIVEVIDTDEEIGSIRRRNIGISEDNIKEEEEESNSENDMHLK